MPEMQCQTLSLLLLQRHLRQCETKTALDIMNNTIAVIKKMKIINIMTMQIVIKTPLNMMMKSYFRKNSKLERNLDCTQSNRGSRKESKSAVKILLPIGRSLSRSLSPS